VHLIHLLEEQNSEFRTFGATTKQEDCPLSFAYGVKSPLEKTTLPRLRKIFPTFYGTQKFIITPKPSTGP
jgi:hypothetical protein